MAAPSAVTAFIRKSRSSKDWIATIGRFTVLFGLGQCAGPILAGYLSDSPSGIRLGLLVSTIALRRPRRTPAGREEDDCCP
jgi:hypothetical protein